jgi:hypothetical protein
VVAITPPVIKTIVTSLWGVIDGTLTGTFAHMAEALFALSVSDANTKNMVDGGVLVRGSPFQQKFALGVPLSFMPLLRLKRTWVCSSESSSCLSGTHSLTV